MSLLCASREYLDMQLSSTRNKKRTPTTAVTSEPLLIPKISSLYGFSHIQRPGPSLANFFLFFQLHYENRQRLSLSLASPKFLLGVFANVLRSSRDEWSVGATLASRHPIFGTHENAIPTYTVSLLHRLSGNGDRCQSDGSSCRLESPLITSLSQTSRLIRRHWT